MFSDVIGSLYKRKEYEQNTNGMTIHRTQLLYVRQCNICTMDSSLLSSLGLMFLG